MLQQVATAADGVRITQAAAYPLGDGTLVGFLCDASTSATLTITDRSTGRTLLSAMPLVAGQYYPLNLKVIASALVTVGGTGSGLLTFTP